MSIFRTEPGVYPPYHPRRPRSVRPRPQQSQSAFRFRKDDGNETAATWVAGENVNITRQSLTPTRLRVQVNVVTSDPPPIALKLQYRKVGDTVWIDI